MPATRLNRLPVVAPLRLIDRRSAVFAGASGRVTPVGRRLLLRELHAALKGQETRIAAYLKACRAGLDAHRADVLALEPEDCILDYRR